MMPVWCFLTSMASSVEASAETIAEGSVLGGLHACERYLLPGCEGRCPGRS